MSNISMCELRFTLHEWGDPHEPRTFVLGVRIWFKLLPQESSRDPLCVFIEADQRVTLERFHSLEAHTAALQLKRRLSVSWAPFLRSRSPPRRLRKILSVIINRKADRLGGIAEIPAGDYSSCLWLSLGLNQYHCSVLVGCLMAVKIQCQLSLDVLPVFCQYILAKLLSFCLCVSVCSRNEHLNSQLFLWFLRFQRYHCLLHSMVRVLSLIQST